ncbi:MAG TPA: hypothetical protein VNT54_00360 [Solirubrobacteraceae bacterium]|nr:hypothetical protein [Solirubrobacteraceae bacterium]
MTKSHHIVRCGALATTLGGAAFVAEGLLYLTAERALQDLLLALAYILVAAGLIGFHEIQRGRLRLSGRLGFDAAIVGWAVALVGHTASLEAVHGLGFAIALVGYLLYGIASFRGRVIPRWSGAAIAVAGPLSLLVGEYTTVVFGLLWVVLGYALWSEAARGAAAGTAPGGADLRASARA